MISVIDLSWLKSISHVKGDPLCLNTLAVKHSIWENNILTLPQQNIPHQTWQQFNCLSDFDASHWPAFKYLNLFKCISTIYDEETSRVQFIFQRIFAFSIIIIIFLSKKMCLWMNKFACVIWKRRDRIIIQVFPWKYGYQ